MHIKVEKNQESKRTKRENETGDVSYWLSLPFARGQVMFEVILVILAGLSQALAIPAIFRRQVQNYTYECDQYMFCDFKVVSKGNLKRPNLLFNIETKCLTCTECLSQGGQKV